jgi:hypothetical protein
MMIVFVIGIFAYPIATLFRYIPRLARVFEGGAGKLRVCSPECEDLYGDYLKPTYGAIARDADYKG